MVDTKLSAIVEESRMAADQKEMDTMYVDVSESESVASSRVGNEITSEEDVLHWDEFFMGVAFLAAMRSKDPDTRVGTCIVNGDRKIVGTGYNGMPNGCDDIFFSWSKDTENILDKKYTFVCHAAVNAVLNTTNADFKNSTMYTGLFPCNECAKIIIQAGIKKIIYYSNKYEEKDTTKAARIMFRAAKVDYEEYDKKLRKKIDIDFPEIVEDFSKR